MVWIRSWSYFIIMEELLIIKDRLSFYILIQSGLISFMCQIFHSLFGVIILPLSMVISVILFPIYSSNKRKTKLKYEIHKVKRNGKNIIVLFLIAILYLSTIPIYSYIKKWTGYEINHLLWVFTTTLIYLKVVISIYVKRIVSE